MYIKECIIDRFGILAGQTIADLPPGLTVFLGNNEAGKSTCLNFFRAMLFGYARKRVSIDYLRDTKSLSGGSLLLDTKALGPVRLLRRPGAHGGEVTLTDPDGTPRPDSDLTVLLRGCTPELFDKVFAFSLDELMNVGSLKDDNIRHALHGAAFGSGNVSPTQVLKSLKDSMQRIFAPRSTTSRTAVLMDALEEVHAQMQQAGNEVTRYSELQQRKEEIEAQLAVVSAARTRLADERRLLDKRQTLRRQWELLRETELLLQSLPIVSGTFAPDGRERLDRLADRLHERDEAAASAKAALSRLEGSLMHPDAALLLAHAPLLTLRERKESMRRAAGQLPAIEQRYQRLNRELATICTDLGPEWTVRHIATADRSLAVYEECRTLGRELHQAETALQKTAEDIERLERERRTEEKDVHTARQSLQQLQGGTILPQGEDETAVLERLAAATVRAADAVEALPRLRQACEEARYALAEAQEVVAVNWNAGRTTPYQFPQTERDSLLSLAERHTLANNTLYTAKVRVAAAEQALDDAHARLAPLEAGFAENTLQRDENALDDAQLLLRRISSAWHDFEGARRRFQADNDQLNNFVSLSRISDTRSAPTDNNGTRYIPQLGAIIALICGALAAYTGYDTQHPPLLYAGGALCILGISLFVPWNRLTRSADSNTTYEDPHAQLEQRLITARQTSQRALETAEQVVSRLVCAAPDMFPNGEFSLEILITQEQRLTRLQQHSLLLERDKSDRDRARSDYALAERRYEKATSTLEEAEAQTQDAQDAWRDKLLRLGLPEQYAPDMLRQLLERLDACTARSKELYEAVQAVEQTTAHITQCLTIARSLSTLAAQIPSPCADSDISTALATIRRYMADSQRSGQKRDRLRQICAERESRLQRMLERIAEATSRHTAIAAQEAEKRSAWQNWLVTLRLSPMLSPETAIAALDILGDAAAKHEESEQLQRQATSILTEILGYTRDILTQASAIKIDIPASLQHFASEDGDPKRAALLLPETLHMLDTATAATAKAVEEESVCRNQYSMLAEANAKLAAAEKQAEQTRVEIQEMLQLAECASLEEYRSTFAQWQKRRETGQERSRLHGALEGDSADLPGGIDALLHVFAATSRDDMDTEAINLDTHLQETAAQEKALAEERGSLAASLAGLMDAEGITGLRRREESLLEELRHESAEWSRMAMAHHLLLQAKKRFEEEGQSGVVPYAKEMFQRITGGAYTGLRIDLDEGAVMAIRRDGVELDPEKELSRGTREQLYLALRLAYVHNHATQAEALPVVMDDILVNFDPRRTAWTADALATFTQEQQVLFFTCHERTADILVKAAPSTAIYRVDNGIVRHV